MALGVSRVIHPRDFMGNVLDSQCVNLPEYIYDVVLVAATDQSVAVPAGANYASISTNAGGAAYMKANSAAQVPGANVLDGSGSYAIPQNVPFLVSLGNLSDGTAVTSLHFISAGTPVISIAWYKG